MNAFDAAGRDGRAEELFHELKDLFIAQNTQSDPSMTSILATFLRVTVTVH
jgi:hypothetical protein